MQNHQKHQKANKARKTIRRMTRRMIRTNPKKKRRVNQSLELNQVKRMTLRKMTQRRKIERSLKTLKKIKRKTIN